MKTSNKGLGIGRWVAVAGTVWLAVWLLYAVTDSKAARNCIHDRKADQAYHALHEHVGFVIVAVARVKLHVACGFVAAGENEGALTGLSGIAVAAFTLTLWLTTSGLLKATEREFVSAHPPKIIVRRVSLDEGSGSVASGISRPWKIQYVIANTGLGKATIFEGNATVAVLERGLPAIPPYDDGIDLPYTISLETGQSRPESVHLEDPILGAVRSKVAVASWDDPMQKASNSQSIPTPNCIYFLGYLLYRDDIGIVRRTAFCRLYDFRTERFTIVQDPDYEYN